MGVEAVLQPEQHLGRLAALPAPNDVPEIVESLDTRSSDNQRLTRIYYERVHCLLALASWARRADPASFRLDEPPTNAEHDLGRILGQAFHQGCSLADTALATGLPPDRVIAIGKRTIRRAKWLSRIAADPDPE
jgi:hypothetical protein